MFTAIIKTIRPPQWLKNLILFAGLLFAGELMIQDHAFLAIWAFVSFCLISSVIYTFNDIIDREKDRNHPIKKERPIARGELSIGVAYGVIVVFLAGGLGLAYFINMNFFYIAVGFVTFNIIYSLFLKKIVIVDVMSIAVSFVIRAYAGVLAINVPASKWLIINTLLLALFLGFGKRRHEILLLEGNASDHRKILDKYSPYLLDQLIGVVTASVVVMYMLYTFSSEVSTKLGTENLFITIPFVVYGIFRYLYLIHKEEKGGSPTSVLLTDKPILATVILWIITVCFVLYM